MTAQATEEPQDGITPELKAEYSAALAAGDRPAVARLQRQMFAKPTKTPKPANDNLEPADQPTDGLPISLCYPPGAVGDFTRFIVSASRFPSPPLALTAALALTAVLAGRRYKSPTGLRTNTYFVGLAESGTGKDLTLRAPRIIAGAGPDGEAIAAKFLDADPASPEGLAMRLRSDPSILASIDEFGKWLADRTSRTAPSYKAGIVSAMMRLTGAASGAWGGAEKAGGKQPTIHAPCFSIHGVSTPSTFWAALGAGNISEGLLGRLVIIDAGTHLPTKVRRPADSETVPAELQAHVQALVGSAFGRSFAASYSTGSTPPPKVVTVPFGDGAEEAYEGFDDQIRAEAPATDQSFRPVLMRVAENAGRLALIVAVGCNPEQPVITVEIQTWANAVAEESYRALVRGASDNIADSERQAQYLRVRGLIARRKASGLTQRDLIKQLRGCIESRVLDDILAQLQGASEVAFGEARSQRGQAMRRWWAVDFKPDDYISVLRPRPGDPERPPKD